MIFDRIESGPGYAGGPAWQAAFSFLLQAGPWTDEGKYPLTESGASASVFRTATLDPEEAVLEAHRAFIDIHVVLEGEERIQWQPLSGLTVKAPYDPAGDFELYDIPESCQAEMILRPGFFAAFFPQDAHRPKLRTGAEAGRPLKKIVIKLPALGL
jgi:biofilm protein TabA